MSVSSLTANPTTSHPPPVTSLFTHFPLILSSLVHTQTATHSSTHQFFVTFTPFRNVCREFPVTVVYVVAYCRQVYTPQPHMIKLPSTCFRLLFTNTATQHLFALHKPRHAQPTLLHLTTTPTCCHTLVAPDRATPHPCHSPPGHIQHSTLPCLLLLLSPAPPRNHGHV